MSLDVGGGSGRRTRNNHRRSRYGKTVLIDHRARQRAFAPRRGLLGCRGRLLVRFLPDNSIAVVIDFDIGQCGGAEALGDQFVRTFPLDGKRLNSEVFHHFALERDKDLFQSFNPLKPLHKGFFREPRLLVCGDDIRGTEQQDSRHKADTATPYPNV